MLTLQIVTRERETVSRSIRSFKKKDKYRKKPSNIAGIHSS